MAPTFQITAQRQTQEITADGRVVPVMEVTFVTPTGTSASINVPIANYSPEYVAALVGDYAARIESVSAL